MKKPATILDLHNQIDTIKNSDLKHIHDCIHRLEDNIQENRTFFTDRLDRLDNRIFWILGIAFTTLVSVTISLIA